MPTSKSSSSPILTKRQEQAIADKVAVQEGAAGRGVASVTVNAGRLIVMYTDGTTQDAGPVTGPKGDPGAPGAVNTLVGQVVVGQTAAVAITLGIREVTVALAGAVVGERYQAFCRSYRLATTGTFTSGRPVGYTVLDCACNVAGQIIVSINAPLLVVGSSYQMTCDIVKVNAA